MVYADIMKLDNGKKKKKNWWRRNIGLDGRENEK
jgi:hypothetical protein